MKFNKFFAIFVMAFVFATSATTFAEVSSDEPFSDVDSSHENYEAITYLHSEEVVEGYSDGKYKSEDLINRAEFVKIVVETQGYVTDGNSNCYLDVKDEWFAPYICTATELGIVSGYGDGNFLPAQNINFAEASKIITEAFLLSVDESNDENWYHNYVVALELLAAIPQTIEAFDTFVTRGEMAEMIWRIDTENTEEPSYTYEEIKTLSEEEVQSILLNSGNDGKVTWSADGVARDGFKVVWSKTEGPSYPTRSTDNYKYLSDPDANSATLNAFDGEGSYYVRVCEYTGGSCDVYSNQVTIFLEGDEASGDVSGITLSDDGDGKVSWVVDGTLSSGVKVVWSMTEGPTYPNRDSDRYQYHSDSSTTSATLDAFDGDGTYFVRVCEYLGGSCGVYSNEVEIELGDSFSSSVTSITVSDIGDNKVSWTYEGTQQLGFKVVWSMNEHPIYPTRDGDRSNYFPDDSEAEATINAFDGAGTYYVRVCEYDGEGCARFSNEIQMEL